MPLRGPVLAAWISTPVLARHVRVCHSMAVSVTSLLDRQIYLYSEVDHLVGLRSGTARRWINGYTRSGRDYAPILREQPQTTEWVTWGEFVETRILAEYRDQKSVPTAQLRAAVFTLREQFGLEYPLATMRPYLVAGSDGLEMDRQAVDGVDGRLVVHTGQLILSDGLPVMERAVLAETESGDQIAEQLTDGEFPGIVMHPGRFGGQPTFLGRRVSVATIAGMVADGDPAEAVAADYGLSIAEVRSATAYAAQHRLSA